MVIKDPGFSQKVTPHGTPPSPSEWTEITVPDHWLTLKVRIIERLPYDDEPATVALMHEYMEQQGYVLDITEQRLHHEIYLSDARKVAPEKLKTVIRHPIKQKQVRHIKASHTAIIGGGAE